MHIKRKERVFFQESPLVEVIAQVRFPKILNLDDARLTNFQEKIKLNYPIVDDQDNYVFKTLDENSYVHLSAERLTLSTCQYNKWPDFLERINEVFSIGKESYNILGASRVGLCYKDFISRKSLGLEGISWKELISTELLGIWGGSTFLDPDNRFIPDESILAMFSAYNIKINDYKLHLKAGLANKSDDSDSIVEEGFMIETDFYFDNWIELNSTADILEHFLKLHEYSSTVFQKCITEKLFIALKPLAQSN